MTKETTPDPANVIPAEPNSEPKQPDPSNSEDKKSDIQRVVESKERYKAELEEERKKRAELEAKIKAREEKELEEQGKISELAEQRKAELEQAKLREAEMQKQIEEHNAQLEEIKKQREDQLAQRIAALPEDKRPPVTESMPIETRESMVKYAEDLLKQTSKSGGVPLAGTTPSDQARLAELRSKQSLTREERLEKVALSAKE